MLYRKFISLLYCSPSKRPHYALHPSVGLSVCPMQCALYSVTEIHQREENMNEKIALTKTRTWYEHHSRHMLLYQYCSVLDCIAMKLICVLLLGITACTVVQAVI